MLNVIAGLYGIGAVVPPAPVQAYESISTSTPSGTGTITFSSIPQTFKHLQIRAIMKSTTTGSSMDDLRIQVNGDTASNYYSHYLWGWNSAANAGSFTSTYMRVEGVIAQATTTSVFGTAIIDVLDYTNTNKLKTFRTLGGQENNGTATQNGIVLESGLWSKAGSGVTSDAITSITLTCSANNYAANTKFALYGIKG